MPIRRAVTTGIIAGIIAGLVMMMYAMFYSLVQNTGFFTPGYHIASFLVGSDDMRAAVDQPWHFAAGPFLLGAMIHMMTATGWGILFALIVSNLRVGAVSTVVLGLLYGMAVLLFMSFVVLQVFPQEEMRQLPQMVGWPSWIVEHGMYGLVLGAWTAWTAWRARAAVIEPREAAGALRYRST